MAAQKHSAERSIPTVTGIDPWLPQELDIQSFACVAFPQNTLIDRAYSVVIIVSILTPVTMTLSQIFVMAGTAGVPAHWSTFPKKGLDGLFGPRATSMLQSFLVLVYSLLFNMRKLTKYLALTLVLVVSMAVKPRGVQRVIRVTLAACYWIYSQWVWLKRRLQQLFTRQKMAGVLEEGPLSGRTTAGSLEHSLHYVGYTLVFTTWFIVSWSLFTYSSMMRDVMGKEEETEVIVSWAYLLLIELFGVEAIKLLLLRMSIMGLMAFIDRTLFKVNPALVWYEQFILHHVAAGSSQKDDLEVDDGGEGDFQELDNEHAEISME
ncbi:hypothetical protein CYMTET_48303 [Cymbomonas tetramitiformis]|uniref:Uncharacterized protein n=1 Tax=Cymbomonas tetramitiformis TaxID=36881 RepID=A0AAE0BSJ4_9CHLO|nr:hypothetical protein CYMTET_48303 [Cymbomonas tetramitiformis]